MHRTLHVLGQAEQTHLDLDPLQPDGPNHMSAHGGLGTEDVLDPRPYRGFLAVGGLLLFSQRHRTGAFFMDLAVHLLLRPVGFPLRRAVGTVAIDRALLTRRVHGPGIQEVVEDLAVPPRRN